MIFVFGSNEAGLHLGGAAKVAVTQYGAEMMKGSGRQGDAYAIPTLGKTLHGRKIAIGSQLSLTSVRLYVEGFIRYAKLHTELEFQVTRIGCGIAGFTDADIAPLFRSAPDNCLFDEAWKPIFEADGVTKRYWGTFASVAPAPDADLSDSDGDDAPDTTDADDDSPLARLQRVLNSPDTDVK